MAQLRNRGRLISRSESKYRSVTERTEITPSPGTNIVVREGGSGGRGTVLASNISSIPVGAQVSPEQVRTATTPERPVTGLQSAREISRIAAAENRMLTGRERTIQQQLIRGRLAITQPGRKVLNPRIDVQLSPSSYRYNTYGGETAGTVMRHWRSEKNPTVESLGFRAQAYAGYAPQLNYKETAGEWGDDVRTGHSGFFKFSDMQMEESWPQSFMPGEEVVTPQNWFTQRISSRAENVLYRQDVLSGKIKKQYENWGVWYNPQTESILGRTGKSYGQYLVTFSTPGGLKNFGGQLAMSADKAELYAESIMFSPWTSKSQRHAIIQTATDYPNAAIQLSPVLPPSKSQTGKWAFNPEGFAFTTFTLATVGAGTAAKMYLPSAKFNPDLIPRPVIRAPRIPTEMGKPKLLWAGLALEYKENALPIAGYAPSKGFTLLRPNINLKQAGYKGVAYVPQTATETSIVSQGIKDLYGSRAASQFKTLFGVERQLQRTPPSFKVKELEKNIQALSPKGVGTVIDFTKRYGGELYGSWTMKQFITPELWSKYRGAKLPADIDVQFALGQAKTEKLANSLMLSLKKGGENVRIQKETPTLIESNMGAGWRHAVDIHSADMAASDASLSSVASLRTYGMRLQQPFIRITGSKLMPPSESGLRKFSSLMTMREKGFYPEAHRVKDIGDWFMTSEQLAKSYGPFKKASILSELEKAKGFYSEEEVVGGRVGFGISYARPSGPMLSVPAIPQTTMGKPSYSYSTSSKSFKALMPASAIYSVSRSASKSISLSPSLSYKVSASPSRSISKSISRSLSRGSRSASLSASASLSPSISPSLSKSLSPSISRSPSPSRSISKSPSRSTSYSYTSYSYSYKTPPPRNPPPVLKLPKIKLKWGSGMFKIKPLVWKEKYTPSVEAIAFGIHGRQPSKLLYQTGLTMRPIKI